MMRFNVQNACCMSTRIIPVWTPLFISLKMKSVSCRRQESIEKFARKRREFSFAILYWSGNKDFLLVHLQDYIEIMLRLLRYLSKISWIFRSNQKAGAFDVFREAKIFVIFSSVALHSSKLWQFFFYFHAILLRRIIVKFVQCDWQLFH